MRERYIPSLCHDHVEPELVECIITQKVYDACSQQECEFFVFEQPDLKSSSIYRYRWLSWFY